MADYAKLAQRIFLYSLIYTIAAFLGVLVLVRTAFVQWRKGGQNSAALKKRRELPPDCLNDPKLGNHCYVQLKNVKLHYVEKGDKTKPLMLLVHGFPEFWYSWRHQIREFSKDYWVVAVDMRGYADSEKPSGMKYYRMKYLLEDLKNLVEALGKEKVILVAHDWGGVIAWYFVMNYPQMVQSYIMMNAPHPVAFRKHLLSSFKQLRMSWYIFFFQLPYLPEYFIQMQDCKFLNVIWRTKRDPSAFTEEDKEAYRFVFGKPGAPTAPINYYRANILPQKRLLKRLPLDGTAPRGLMIFGADDLAISTEIVEKTKRLTPNLDTELVQNASHFVQQDDPASVNKLMTEFLAKVAEGK